MKNRFFKRMIALLLSFSILIPMFGTNSNAEEGGDSNHNNSVNEYIAEDLEIGNLQRNSEEAKNVALDFLGDKMESSDLKEISDGIKNLYRSKSDTKSSEKNLYIFNRDGGGYVIVSGDKRASDILAYSDTGEIDLNNSPENLKNWLQEYEKQIEFIQNNPSKFKDNIEAKIEAKHSDSREEVAPFMADILWDQGDPYNLLAPDHIQGVEKSASGCVATAMAMVMKYYEYPTKGLKDAEYIWKHQVIKNEEKLLKSDISNHIYDWKNMPKDYTGVTDKRQRQEVAQLMYDCGVAIKMSYGQTSWAFSQDAVDAFKENFGYDKGIKLLGRDYYSKSEWLDIINKELKEKRPVFYGGSGEGGGHQFIVDGHDGLNLYHINWGWSGMSNGYFALDALNPVDLGIGSAGGSYNLGQQIAVGIKPAEENTEIISKDDLDIRILSTGKLIDSKGENIIANLYKEAFETTKDEKLYTLWWMNIVGHNEYGIEFRLGFEDEGKTIIFEDPAETEEKLKTGLYDWTSLIDWSNAITPENNEKYHIKDGEYKMTLYKKNENGSYTPVPSKGGNFKYITVKLLGDKVIYSIDSTIKNKMKLTKFNKEKDWNFYSNGYGRFELAIKNLGEEEYNSTVYLLFKNKNTKENYISFQKSLQLDSKEEKSFKITEPLVYMNYEGRKVAIPSGEYEVSVLYNVGNQGENIDNGFYDILDNPINLNIKDNSNVKMTIEKNPEFINNKLKNNNILSANDLATKMSIKVENGIIEGELYKSIFDSENNFVTTQYYGFLRAEDGIKELLYNDAEKEEALFKELEKNKKYKLYHFIYNPILNQYYIGGKDGLFIEFEYVEKSDSKENKIVDLERKSNKELILVGGVNTLTERVESQLMDFVQYRLSGKDRYATSVAVAKEYSKSNIVLLTSGEKYTDELTATVLANKLGAPIMLTRKDAIPAEVKAEINRLGATKVILIGGNASISEKVEKELANYTVERIGGPDRYDTAILVGNQVRNLTASKTGAILVDGTDFPDAIAMTSMGVEQNMPILLTKPGQLPASTAKTIEDWKLTKVTIGGGSKSVSEAVEQEVRKYAEVNRIAGADRYETSVLVAEQVYVKPKHAVIASGEVFPDAIVGAPYAAKKGYPIVLSRENNVPDVVMDYILDNR